MTIFPPYAAILRWRGKEKFRDSLDVASNSLAGLVLTEAKQDAGEEIFPDEENKPLFNERFVKVALHELGHTMGLPHCIYSNTCFMESAEGSIKSVDRETKTLCAHCKKLLNQLTQ